jgi:hypothetical protein
MCQINRHRRCLGLAEHRQIRSGNRAFLEEGAIETVDKADCPISVPQLKSVGFVQRLVVSLPGDLHDAVTRRCHVRNRGHRERRTERQPPMASRVLGDGSGVVEIKTWWLR